MENFQNLEIVATPSTFESTVAPLFEQTIFLIG